MSEQRVKVGLSIPFLSWFGCPLASGAPLGRTLVGPVGGTGSLIKYRQQQKGSAGVSSIHSGVL